MDVGPHARAERVIDEAVTLERLLAGEGFRHDERFEVHTVVTAHGDFFTRQSRRDQAFDFPGIHRRIIANSIMMRRMFAPAAAIVVGFAALAWGADRFVLGAASTARSFGVSPMLIGLTVVALGTAAPEMLVAILAAIDGKPGIAIGNALGSNLTNLSLVLGCAALVAPLTIRSRTLRNELPVLLAIIVLAWLALADGVLSRMDGALLVAGVVPLLWWMTRLGRIGEATADPLSGEFAAVAEEKTLARGVAQLWLVVGLATLLAGSRGVVWGASTLAAAWGVSDTVIGLSVVAIGTSLPELGASVVAALKGEDEIAVGNVLGANMFNLLVVLAAPGLLAPGAVERAVTARDLPLVLGLTVGVAAVAWLRRGRLGRGIGGALVVAFVAYQWLLYD